MTNSVNVDASSNHSGYEDSLKSKEKKFLTTKQVGGLLLAGIAIFSALGTGCSAKSPNQIQSTTTETTATNPASTETTKSPEKTVEDYVDAMQSYKDMNVESFDNLPRDERLQYSEFLADQVVERGNYDRMYGPEKGYDKYAIKPSEATLEDDGQKIVDNYQFAIQIAFGQFIEGDGSFDYSDGQKALSSVYYNVAGSELSNGYNYLVNAQKKLNNPKVLMDIVTATDTSKLMEGVRDGETVQYKIVEMHNNADTTLYVRYIYKEFTGYDGKQKTTWLLDQAESTLNRLNNLYPIKNTK